MKTIVILSDRRAKELAYAVDHHERIWRDKGYKVIRHYGLENIPAADVYVTHIDLTVIPDDYIQVIQSLPNALNSHVTNTSRTGFSRLLLRKDSEYSGPVIVKTNANFGGLPERSTQQSPATKPTWRTTSIINPYKYPVFKNKELVSDDMWNNPHLIVEAYIAKPKNGLFYVNYFSFFGHQEMSGRVASPSRIVKFDNCTVEENIPAPTQVKQWRKKFKMDFGRFDYIQKEDGECILLDINKTEGSGGPGDKWAEEFRFFAAGIESYL